MSGCPDDYDGNQTEADAYNLQLDATDTVRGIFGNGVLDGEGAENGADQLQVCDGEPDFFTFELPCAGFLAVELIREDETVMVEDEDYVERDPNGRIELTVQENGQQVADLLSEPGEFYLKPLHRYAQPGLHTIEVSHGGGATQQYSLQVTFLPAGTCATAEWACEATSSMAAVETACDATPVSGACPMGSITSTSAPLPTFTENMSSVPGWVVHTTAAHLRNIHHPTAEDQASILHRCEAACEREWSDNPHVAANCGGVDVFEAPRRLATPSLGAVQLIPASQVDGSGLFSGQALSCDLHDDCCEAFDEALCAAAPARVTPASSPLGRGVETVYAVDDDVSSLTASDGTTVDDVKLHGSIGISECTAGSGSLPCPIYLGSLEVKSIGSLVIPITCPWGTVNRTLYNLEIDLVQPAFGIAKGGSDDVGFPPGALVFDATFSRNAQTVTVRGANVVPVTGTVSGSGVTFDDIAISGMMPGCTSSEQIPVDGTFALAMDLSGAPEEQPPTLSLTLPSSVACPSSVNLTATASDPDGDLDVVRWYVDGILLDAATTSIVVDTAHSVRAVAYDQRGAATTATHAIQCN